ncbi:endothelin-converting enzyme 2 [Bicyclus anynana]|uniref:Endothelin-converting enzyme 2 n=1 Tax=Bicyclus anynana TaxID=110368 RepID=A0ABM3LST6_BICAN|nr:endothelin-converting enzyme 2 [Bicyclus anynana]
MNAWAGEERDIMGPTVTRAASAKTITPPLKNGNELREAGYLIAVGSRTARFRRKHRNKFLLILLLALILLLLCLTVAMTVLYVKQKRNKPVRICHTKECLRSAANLALSMDPTTHPCQDFYQYVCGNWAEEHPRPDAYRSYDWFREKQNKVYAVVRDFLTHNTTDQPKPVQQAKDLYTACMDTEKLDKLSLKPVFKILKSLGLPLYPTFVNATEHFDYSTYKFDWLEAVINVKTQLGMDVLIGFDLFTDPKNSLVYRLVMGSPETTNPFPSMHNEKKQHIGQRNFVKRNMDYRKKNIRIFNNYYEQNDNKFESLEYKDDEEKAAHIYKLFYAELIKLFILESAPKDSNITELELDQNIFLAADEFYTMSENMYELEADNDTSTGDDDQYLDVPEYDVDEVQAHTDMIVLSNNGTPVPIWKRYLEGVFNISDVELDFKKDKILISDPDLKYMSLMAAYLSRAAPVTVELYIWIKVVEVMAAHTTTELRLLFQRSYDALRQHDLTMPPRSLYCASAVNDLLGMAVSYAIAKPDFLTNTKPKIQVMLSEMKNSLSRLVGKTKWMDEATKLATYQKITEMKTLVGFPDWLLEQGKLEEFYEGIEVDTMKHLENLINIIQVKIKNALNRFRIGNNVTWATDPTEVNAYHTFQENTITVPLVMLQYPFYDLGLDSLNYGSLGTVLGHEITHGFDNFGRQFDKNGNLLPWWTNGTIASFVNLTQCFVDQYSSYFIPELNEHVDGKKTLGENIADNGGVREAFGALKEHLFKNGEEPKLPGFEHLNSEQLFFLSYGNVSIFYLEGAF